MVDLLLDIQTDIWQRTFPDVDFQDLIDRSVGGAFAVAGADMSRLGEIEISLSNDATVHELNRTYRGKDKPTNVLSFPMEPHPPKDSKLPWLVGNVIIAFETVRKESIDQEKSFTNHLSHLIIHGTLHLLGYDHISDDEAELMEGLEIKALERLNIENPYHDRDNI